MPNVRSENVVVVSTATNREFKQAREVKLQLGGGHAVYMFWATPFGRGISMSLSELFVTTSVAWATVDITVTAVDVPWDANTLTVSNQPAATGPSVTVNNVTLAVDTLTSLNITSLMTAVSGGRPWYGIKITADVATSIYGQGTWNLQPEFRTQSKAPFVQTSWIVSATQPINLIPDTPTTSHRISDASPTLGWDGNGVAQVVALEYERPMLEVIEHQVQIDNNSDFSSPTYDSGWAVLPLMTRLNLDSLFTAVAGTTYYWRVRARASDGVASNWSTTASFIYKAPPTITLITPAPPDTYDPTPTVTWSFTGAGGEIQQWAGVNIIDVATGQGVYSSGLSQGTFTSLEVPPGYLWYDRDYRFDLVVFTNGNRVATADQPAYFVRSATVLMAYDGTVAPPDTLVVTPDPNFPWTEVKWTYTDTVPDMFHVMRDGTIVSSAAPSFYATGGPAEYRYFDFAPNRTTHIWQIVAVISGLGSSDGTPGVSKEVRHNFSWLTQPGMLGGVMLGNLAVEKEVPGNTTVVEPLSGKVVVVTQGASVERGRITARLADNIVPVTAKEMLANFYTLRDVFGGRAKLFLADRILDVFIWDLVQYEKTSNDGMRYDIEFNYMETK